MKNYSAIILAAGYSSRMGERIHVLKEPFPHYEECMEILRLSDVKQETLNI
ncbi:MAG: hypothetical protein LLF98_08895 [Clostridium sp.]|uniref:hypothetical protein n=1 Tax=Clostridium sp. TaxID=1506 RepID=UPI0025C3EF0B|nr:hypothetical protein [Clostridium sp.]MCE5221360.1 hypothetical protein [Clostridium sp.]